MANWIQDFLKYNPEFASKKVTSWSLHHIAFATGKGKTIWHFTNVPFKSVGADYLDSTNDGFIYGADPNYATSRSTSGMFNPTSNYFSVGQWFTGAWYYMWRSFLKFDTSAIPDGDTVIQVNLKMVCIGDTSDTDFDVQIIKQDWSAQDPLSDANREAAYDKCLAGTLDDSIWRNTAGIALNTQYASGNLNCTWVNKIGSTYYSLRSSRDYGNNAPTGNEYIYLASQDHTTEAYRPILTVVSEALPSIVRPMPCNII